MKLKLYAPDMILLAGSNSLVEGAPTLDQKLCGRVRVPCHNLKRAVRRSEVRNIEAIKNRYLQDDLQVRLGGIAANLARIASCSTHPHDWEAVQSMLEESTFFIEWTAPEASLNVQASLVELQIKLALWHHVWPKVYTDRKERDKLGGQARSWSQNVLMLRE